MIYDSCYLQQAYRRSPRFMQNLLVSAYGLGKRWEQLRQPFNGYSKELEQTQWWSAQQLRELQDARLRALIRHAYEHVPYYRRIFDERGWKPADVATAEDLYKLPVLTKQDVRRHYRELQADNIPRSRFTLGTTGGSTGIPLQFSLDKDRVIFDHALIHRHWSWAGFRRGDLVVVVRGLPLVAPETASDIYWRHDWADHRIYLSGFHLSLRSLPRYIAMLNRWKPRFIAGYPSNIFTLARFLERQNQQVPVAAVFTSSELLTALERKVIEKQFACQVWDRYGTGERLAVTQQCQCGRYHQNVEFGILQVDAPRGQPAASGQQGEVIQTSLTNFSMPLIRYAIGDMAWELSGSCPCGRGLPLLGAVEGRKDDVIVTRDGRIMPRAGLDQIHEYVPNLERCQLLQEKIGEVVLRVLPRPDFGPADVQELVRQLRARLGESTQVRVQMVDRLELSVTGKERFIVSRLNLEAVTGLSLDTAREPGVAP